MLIDDVKFLKCGVDFGTMSRDGSEVKHGDHKMYLEFHVCDYICWINFYRVT